MYKVFNIGVMLKGSERLYFFNVLLYWIYFWYIKSYEFCIKILFIKCCFNLCKGYGVSNVGINLI